MNKTNELLKMIYDFRKEPILLHSFFKEMRYTNDRARKVYQFLRDYNIIDVRKHKVLMSKALSLVMEYEREIHDIKATGYSELVIKELTKDISLYFTEKSKNTTNIWKSNNNTTNKPRSK